MELEVYTTLSLFNLRTAMRFCVAEKHEVAVTLYQKGLDFCNILRQKNLRANEVEKLQANEFELISNLSISLHKLDKQKESLEYAEKAKELCKELPFKVYQTLSFLALFLNFLH